MTDRWEPALDRRPHALGRRVLRDELRVSGLELVQLLEEEVVLAVADRRRVEHVVAVVRLVERSRSSSTRAAGSVSGIGSILGARPELAPGGTNGA